ncbi:MAG: saccharopine dehydrogenase NADP-binding domain-containing protein [Nitrososphaerales archaeon]|jgi:saccharopine dehydrogenase (NAD+, L-lysine-forming)
MDVLVIGVGSVGSVIAQYLRQDDSISSLTLADKDISRARGIAAKRGKTKVKAVKVDASNPKQLEKLMKGKDMVINSGHYIFNEPLMQLCVKLGVNYVDLASGKIMDQLAHDDEFRKAKVLGVVGLGEDPGLSNIYARCAADKLKTVKEIKVRDGEFSVSKLKGFVPLFSPEIFFEEVLMNAIVFTDGKFKHLPPMTEKETYEFPPPMGKQTVYALEHEEVQTLPNYIKKGVRYVDFKLALSDEFVSNVNLLKELGLLSTSPMNVKGVQVRPFDVFIATLPIPVSVASALEGHAGISVEVSGTAHGKDIKYTLSTQMSHQEAYKRFKANATSFLTGVVPAVYASTFAKGKIKQTGVIPAEMLDADLLVGELARAGVKTTMTKSEEGILSVAG